MIIKCEHRFEFFSGCVLGVAYRCFMALDLEGLTFNDMHGPDLIEANRYIAAD